MKKAILLIVVIVFGGFLYSTLIKGDTSNIPKTLPGVSSPAAQETAELVRTTAEPAELIIPSLSLSASIEYVGMDEKGNMDVPKDDMHVAWYELGYQPGENGNAVMAGHLDTASGVPAIFYELDQLQKGDKLLVRAQDGTQLTFLVTHTATYENESFPLVEVFGPHEKPRLNLITCEGQYDRTARNYSHRTVVYSELQ